MSENIGKNMRKCIRSRMAGGDAACAAAGVVGRRKEK